MPPQGKAALACDPTAMSMTFAPGDDDEIVSAINTTPLVDVMLVLLIIFLITIPVVTHTVPLSLPKKSTVARQSEPEHIVVRVDRNGSVFWNREPVADFEALRLRLSNAGTSVPQPEVQTRGDAQARYASIGRVLDLVRRASIRRVSFITQPPPNG